MWLFDRAFRKLIREGELTVTAHDGRTYRYGAPSDRLKPAHVRFTDRTTPERIVLDPALGAGEAYMDGRLVMAGGELLDLLALVTGNGRWEDRGGIKPDRRWRKLGNPARLLATVNRATRSKRNVAHHYDLSAKLYDLFLDADRQYSCAYFTDPATETLERAQADKKAHIAAKLALRPGQRVLDIGCGWGGMALYLNRVADVDVLGITLSEEQLAIARRRAQEAGVADRVRFELVDYRHLTGTYDRIVSVGMFEHVGPAHYQTFFAKCRELLAPDGVMLLHTIGRTGPRKPTDRWTVKYIFPGGYIPTLSEMAEAAEATRLFTTDVEMLRLHYHHTLIHWLRRAQANRAGIEALYDARFYRMWEFYLAGSACGFLNGQMVNYQLQLTRDRLALPITRDYMGEAEAALRETAPA